MNSPEGESSPKTKPKEAELFGGLVDLLKAQDVPLAHDILFKSRLAAEFVGSGSLLKALEEAGILPQTDVGNPYDIATHPQEFEKWYEEHPEEAAQFHAAMDERTKAMRYIYLGTVLGDLFGNSLYPDHEYIIAPRRKKSSQR